MVPGKSSSTHDQLYWARNYYTLDLDRGVIVRWICGQGNWQGGGQEYGQGRKQTKWQTMKGKRWWGSWQADWWTRYWIRHTHLTRFDAMVVTCVIGQLRHRQTNYSVNEKCPCWLIFSSISKLDWDFQKIHFTLWFTSNMNMLNTIAHLCDCILFLM